LIGLSKVTNKGRRQLIEILKILENKGLIRVESNAGFKSTYFITNKFIEPEKLSTDTEIRTTTRAEIRTTPRAEIRTTTRADFRTRSNINRSSKREIERAEPRARTEHIVDSKTVSPPPKEKPLSDFYPDDANVKLCYELKLTLIDEIESFKNRHKAQKTQYEFGRWIQNSYRFNLDKQNKSTTYTKTTTGNVTTIREESLGGSYKPFERAARPSPLLEKWCKERNITL
jgi:hypothetical protein